MDIPQFQVTKRFLLTKRRSVLGISIDIWLGVQQSDHVISGSFGRGHIGNKIECLGSESKSKICVES